MVEQAEQPETVHEHHAHGGAGDGPSDAGFRRWAAIYVGVVAMLLAIATLGGGKATKEMLAANIRASDTYAFAQAKYLRQTAYELAADQLDAEIAALPAMPDPARSSIAATADRYRKAAARYASDPASGEGRRELIAKAKEWDAARDHAEAQDPNFQFAAALFQIAIVLGSVAIVAASRALLGFSAAIAAVAVALTVNGYLLLVPLAAG
ncbi:MAG TPA: DUF4337 domain-containing protein [Stellaceae bacterium]|nr:DUF4337 domain-containing protein [Stellaceae bacterium]